MAPNKFFGSNCVAYPFESMVGKCTSMQIMPWNDIEWIAFAHHLVSQMKVNWGTWQDCVWPSDSARGVKPQFEVSGSGHSIVNGGRRSRFHCKPAAQSASRPWWHSLYLLARTNITPNATRRWCFFPLSIFCTDNDICRSNFISSYCFNFFSTTWRVRKILIMKATRTHSAFFSCPGQLNRWHCHSVNHVLISVTSECTAELS